MNKRTSILVGWVVIFLTGLGIGVLAQEEQPTQPQVANNVGTVFAYQGRLSEDTQPANGPYDMEFRLFDADSNQIGNIVTQENIAVTNGLFNVDLDFGENVFSGTTRYLEIAVRPGSSTGNYETLNPRVVIHPVPYAQHAGSAYTVATEMLPPTVETVAATSGGSLSAGLYYFKIVASDGVGTTISSEEELCTVDGINTNRCVLTWTPVIGAATYWVYKGSTANGQNLYQVATGTTYNYDTDSGATPGTVPTTNTAFVNNLSPSGNSWLLGGNLGIGTTIPEASVHFYRDRYTLYGPNSGWGAYLQVGGTARNPDYASMFTTNGNLHIDSRDGGSYATHINHYSQNNTFINAQGGNVGIGTLNPTSRLQVGNSGDGTAALANAWNIFSDVRYKTDITQIENAAELVTQLEGVRFTWKESGKTSVGFIAQDVQAVLPELVHADDAGYLSVDYGKMTPVLVEAVKEQQSQIEELQQQNEQLTAELATIHAQLAALETVPHRFLFSISDFGFVFLMLVGVGIVGWQKRGS